MFINYTIIKTIKFDNRCILDCNHESTLSFSRLLENKTKIVWIYISILLHLHYSSITVCSGLLSSESMSTNAERTAYQKVFSQVRWGRGDLAEDEIIQNRDDFVTEFNISKRKVDLPGKRMNNEVHPVWPNIWLGNFKTDHFEMYQKKDKAGYVALFSNYGKMPLPQVLIDLGYKLYKPLYTGDAMTYLVEIPHLKPK